MASSKPGGSPLLEEQDLEGFCIKEPQWRSSQQPAQHSLSHHLVERNDVNFSNQHQVDRLLQLLQQPAVGQTSAYGRLGSGRRGCPRIAEDEASSPSRPTSSQQASPHVPARRSETRSSSAPHDLWMESDSSEHGPSSPGPGSPGLAGVHPSPSLNLFCANGQSWLLRNTRSPSPSPQPNLQYRSPLTRASLPASGSSAGGGSSGGVARQHALGPISISVQPPSSYGQTAVMQHRSGRAPGASQYSSSAPLPTPFRVSRAHPRKEESHKGDGRRAGSHGSKVRAQESSNLDHTSPFLHSMIEESHKARMQSGASDVSAAADPGTPSAHSVMPYHSSMTYYKGAAAAAVGEGESSSGEVEVLPSKREDGSSRSERTDPGSVSRRHRPSSSVSNDGSRPYWMQRLHDTRRPVPWDDLDEAWADAKTRDPAYLVSDLPAEVQRDLAQAHQAMIAQREIDEQGWLSRSLRGAEAVGTGLASATGSVMRRISISSDEAASMIRKASNDIASSPLISAFLSPKHADSAGQQRSFFFFPSGSYAPTLSSVGDTDASIHGARRQRQADGRGPSSEFGPYSDMNLDMSGTERSSGEGPGIAEVGTGITSDSSGSAEPPNSEGTRIQGVVPARSGTGAGGPREEAFGGRSSSGHAAQPWLLSLRSLRHTANTSGGEAGVAAVQPLFGCGTGFDNAAKGSAPAEPDTNTPDLGRLSQLGNAFFNKPEVDWSDTGVQSPIGGGDSRLTSAVQQAPQRSPQQSRQRFPHRTRLNNLEKATSLEGKSSEGADGAPRMATSLVRARHAGQHAPGERLTAIKTWKNSVIAWTAATEGADNVMLQPSMIAALAFV